MHSRKQSLSKRTVPTTAKSSITYIEEINDLKRNLNHYKQMEANYVNSINKYEVVKKLLIEYERKLDITLKENQTLIKENEKVKEKMKKLMNINRQIMRKYGTQHELCRDQHSNMVNPFKLSKFKAGVRKKLFKFL